MENGRDSVEGFLGVNRSDRVGQEPSNVRWFYCRTENDKPVWVPFTNFDNRRLEEYHRKCTCEPV